jgi:hypothetical protein
MVKLILKYGYLDILKLQDSVFYNAKLVKDITLSEELIRLNYLKFSPFEASSIVSYKEKLSLYLWFYKKKSSAYFIVPEAYLLYKELKKIDTDTIYIVKDNPLVVLVIKNSLLDAVFLSPMDISHTQLQDEFNIENIKVIEKSLYEELLIKGLKNLKLQELFKFSQINFDYKKVLNTILVKYSYLIIFILFLSMGVSYMEGKYQESRISELTKEYNKSKNKNSDLKSIIKEHNKQVSLWNKFMHNELQTVDHMAIINSLNSVIKPKEKATFNSVKINSQTMVVVIATDLNSVVFLNRLNAIKFFKTVTIQNSYKRRNGLKVITYAIRLKDIGN